MMLQNPNEEILKKIAGDPTTEAPEAAYRLAASLFVEKVTDKAMKSIEMDPHLKSFLVKNKQITEFVVGFVLAATLELLPVQGFDDQRTRLAYNLRVLSYQEIEALGLSFISAEVLLPLIKFIREEAHEAIESVSGNEGARRVAQVYVDVDFDVDVEAERYSPEPADRDSPEYRHIQDMDHSHKHEHGGSYHYHRHSHQGGGESHSHSPNNPMLERNQRHGARYHR